MAAAEGHVPCLKYIVACEGSVLKVLGARNDNGETPKMLAQQFFKVDVQEYINGLEQERDKPEEKEGKFFLSSSIASD